MNEVDRRIGFWSILLLTCVGYLYAISYVLVASLFPMKPWVDIQTFAADYVGSYRAIFTVTQVLAWILSFIFVIVGVVIYKQTKENRRIFSIIGMIFAAIFLSFSSMHYYVQWTSVYSGLQSGNLAGLSLLVQSNFDSPISVINILGWTFFFGISNLSFAFCFSETKRGKMIRFGLLISGIVSVGTAIMFALGIKIMMLVWTIVLVLSWYVYPVMLKDYLRREADAASSIQ